MTSSQLTSLMVVTVVAWCPALASAQECAAGRTATETSGWHCCWPGQTWGASERACIGPPACPNGLVAHGESCVPGVAPSPGVLIQPLPPAIRAVTPFVPATSAATPAAAAAPVDVRVVPAGAPGWPSSLQAPTADVNPRYEREAGDPTMLGAGITFFALGYLVAGGFGIAMMTSGDGIPHVRNSYYYGYDQRDQTCHEATGAVGLIPVLGSVLAMITAGACTVPQLERVEDSSGRFLGHQATGSRVGMDLGFTLAWAVPTAVFQLLGFGLILGGVTGSHQSFRVGPEAGGESARLTIQPYAAGAQAGLSLRVDF